jgi:hypothetical protein
MAWKKKSAKAKREQQRRSTERKKATATATPLHCDRRSAVFIQQKWQKKKNHPGATQCQNIGATG